MKEIIYFGRDNLVIDEVLKNLKKFVKDEVKLSIVQYDEGEIAKCLIKTSTKIIFFEFTEEVDKNHSFSKELIRIRKLRAFSGVAVCGVLSSQADKNVYKSYLNNGVTLSYIKGTEIGTYIGLLVKIAYGENINVFNFVAAKNLDYSITMYQECPVFFFSTEALCIGTDVLNTNMSEEVEVKFDMIGDITLEELYPIKTSEFPSLYPFMNMLLFELPEDSAWGGEEAIVLPVDTIETWVDHNKEDLIANKKQIMIFTQSLKLLKYAEELNNPLMDLIVIDNIDSEDEIKNIDYFSIMAPSIVFYDIEDSTSLTHENLANFISSMSISGVNALVVVGNCLSTSIALQKVFGYENIVCTKNHLNGDIVEKCCNMYTGHGPVEEIDLNRYYPKSIENMGYCEYKFNVQLTLISENMIKFKSETQLALFTVVKYNVPFEMNIIIFDVEMNESLQNEIYDYQGMIFGIDSIGEDTLRRLVNQIIDHPPTVFDTTSVEKLLNTQNEKEIDVKNLENKKDAFIREKQKNVEKKKVMKSCLSEDVLLDRKLKKSKL